MGFTGRLGRGGEAAQGTVREGLRSGFPSMDLICFVILNSFGSIPDLIRGMDKERFWKVTQFDNRYPRLN